MENKYKIQLEIYVSLLITVLLIMGVSYAYYRKTISQESRNDISGLTCLDLEISDKTPAISLTEVYPIPDAEGLTRTPYTFTITNKCNQYLEVNLGVETLATSEILAKYVKGVINDEGNLTETPSILSNNPVGTAVNGGSAYYLKTSTLKAKESKSFDLLLWLDEATTSAQAFNKKYQGKVIATATARTNPNSNLDTSGANEPLLADNMIPVTYDNVNDI